jgi:hypothetical protein
MRCGSVDKERKGADIMKKMWFIVMFVMVLMAMPSAFAQGTGSISATSISCPTGSNGTVDVEWSTSGVTSQVGVYVLQSENAGDPDPTWTLVWGGASGGPNAANWISPATTYTFQIYGDLNSSYGLQSGSYQLWEGGEPVQLEVYCST